MSHSTRDCPRCGTPYASTQSACADCLNAAKRAKRAAEISLRPTVQCISCGANFRPVTTRNNACSSDCYKAHGRRLRGTPERPKAATCAHCGGVFMPTRRDARFCALRCKGLNQFPLKGQRRRARKRGSQIRPIRSAQVVAKMSYWGGKCWMCSGAADTLDHVKPLAAGGYHMLANLRPACRSCNSSKGAKWFGPENLSIFIRH